MSDKDREVLDLSLRGIEQAANEGADPADPEVTELVEHGQKALINILNDDGAVET